MTLTAAPPPVFRLTVEQYRDLFRKGVLAEDAPVELLAGMLVEKRGRNPPHRFATQTLADLLKAMMPPGWFVDVREAATTDDSEPEPDVCVVRGSRRDFVAADRHPGPADVGILIEVADTSLDTDRLVKVPIYAEAGYPEYWIVNIPDSVVEVHTDPDRAAVPADYRGRRVYSVGDAVPVVIDGVEAGRVSVADLFA